MTRTRQLSEGLYDTVFKLLEPEYKAADAALVASHVQKEFERKVNAVVGRGR